jgi:hypothetical protein
MTIEAYLDHCYVSFFAPLLRPLALAAPTKSVAEVYGYYEATGRNLRIRLENERGLTGFRVGPVHELSGTYDVELLTHLFPEWQVKRGTVRLDLSQQARFLHDRWEELNKLFAPTELGTTRQRLHELDIARSNRT